MDALNLAKQLEQKVKAGKPVKVTKEFLEAFDYVTKYYECTPEEILEMKALARGDMLNAKPCFESIYRRLLCL